MPLVFLEGGCWEEGNVPCAENRVCAKQLLEQSGAVCLLSGGVFLSEPRWLLDLNCLFVERLKCVKEIRWESVGFFAFLLQGCFQYE